MSHIFGLLNDMENRFYDRNVLDAFMHEFEYETNRSFRRIVTQVEISFKSLLTIKLPKRYVLLQYFFQCFYNKKLLS